MEHENLNEIIVESLNEYLTAIRDMRKNLKEEQGDDIDTQRYFFRGQADCNWDVTPGVFRDNYLSKEAELINSAYLRNPSEFRKLDTDFEKLAKLQHYGLPTRLLDVTSNPLIALYFACQTNEETNLLTDEVFETDGAVLFKRTYSKGYNDLEVAVVSHVANLNIDGDMTLDLLLEELQDKGIYTQKMVDKCKEYKYQSLIDVLQTNYFVISNMNNERLIRQSGLFLLVSKYNIAINEKDKGKSVIQPAKSSARTDFDESIFRIPADKKSEILQELDMYNINEGALFPELEHQMSYIKQFNNGKSLGEVGNFSKVEVKREENKGVFTEEPTDAEIESAINNAVDNSGLNKVMHDDLKDTIKKNLSLDWYKKETVLSQIRNDLTDVLMQYGLDRIDARKFAKSIVESIINLLL